MLTSKSERRDRITIGRALSAVGKSPEMIGARERATGQALFTVDFKLPGMLYAKILRSPHPHAKILNIDTAKAERVPGIRAVLTHKEARILFAQGKALNQGDEYALDDRVRYAGDKVAAVAGTSLDVVEEAMSLIQVDYELLPAVFEPQEALSPDAPKIHPQLERLDGNLFGKFTYVYGNLDEGFMRADHVFTNKYTTSRVTHCALEPHVNIAAWDLNGGLTMWGSEQGAFDNRDRLARSVGLPMSKVRFIVPPYVGGGFGGKSGGWAESIICALIAKKVGKPVMLKLNREEETTTTRTRSPCVFETKTGVKNDGTFTARQIKAYVDLGAYAHGSWMVDRAQFYYSTLYRCPNIQYEGYGVYTNTAPSGQMRGFSSVAIHFPMEAEIDDIAHELGMDPLEMRLKNCIRNGDVIPFNGVTVTGSGLNECILKGMRHIGWERRQKKPNHAGSAKKKGIGMALMIHYASKLNPQERTVGAAMLKVNDDGSILLSLGTPELGQGLRTAMTQIAAESVGARLEDINVTLSDTGATPWGGPVAASRTTYETGGAVHKAGLEVRLRLLNLASKLLDVPVEDLDTKESRVYVKASPEKGLSFGEIVSDPSIHYDGNNLIVCTAAYSVPEYVAPFGAHFAEVEVDTETGQVKILRMAAAHDVGRAIHPVSCEGQIEGGVSMGLGYALTEEIVYDKKTGQPLNKSFLDYKVLRAPDLPPIAPILVEPIHPVTVYGIKGIGEHSGIPTPPAIRNAIFNAIGAQINELPITPEKILQVLRQK